MARETKRLTARGITSLTAPGMYADGDGLYLRVDAAGSKRWALLFRWPDPATGEKKRTEMGLGRLADVGLADAREKAAEARKQIAEGVNPIQARILASEARAQTVRTFGMEAESYIDTHATSFRNPKHVDQWRMTLSAKRDKAGELMDSGYCLTLRKLPVAAIETEHVLAVLKPLWLEKPETASRLRGRIERVLDAAKSAGHRTGENPARWRGHLATLLPKRKTLSRGHHAAMPYAQLPAFVAKLRESGGMGARALELLILCSSRTGEIIGAKWPEFDLDSKVWTIPAIRMKAAREHRVALSARAVEILRELAEIRTGDFVFPGKRANSHMSNMTMTKALATAGGDAYTVHGFRSAFRDWVGEETSFPETLAEMALAHIVGDATERAYRRGDALAKRRKLSDAWAAYCQPATKTNVVPMARKATA